jgi:eukaryotic-like serine/threonine-protein kinase
MSSSASQNPGPLSSAKPNSEGRGILGRHRAFARLARGGMADIYLALSEGSVGANRLVVIKRLRHDVEAESETRLRDMFYDEARLTTQLNHPNIVQTYEVGEDQGALFMVLEYAEGHTLQEISRLARGHASLHPGKLPPQDSSTRPGLGMPNPNTPDQTNPSSSRLVSDASKPSAKMSPRLVARLMCEVLSGLHYAHELSDLSGMPLNIVHRDVSPQNILVGYDGRVRLLDFGIAKAAMHTSQTEVGMYKGKVRYMSPEHVSPNGAIDRRADVFSTGVVLWEQVTGSRLFTGDGSVTSLLALADLTVPVRSVLEVDPELDPELARIVAKSLEKRPEDRYATALAMKEDLARFLSKGEPTDLTDLGNFVTHHGAERRAIMQRRIREQLAASQAEPENQERNVNTLDSLSDLKVEHSMAPPSISGVARTKGTQTDVQTPKKAAALISNPDADIPIEVGRVSDSSGRKQRQKLFWVGAALVFMLGALVAVLLVLLLKSPKAPEPQATGPTSADVLSPQQPQRIATPATPLSAGVSVGSATTVEREVLDRNKKPPANAPPWPPVPKGPIGGQGGGVPVPTPVPKSEPGPPAPEPTPASAVAKDPGFLSIDTTPWTNVSEGGRRLGQTPLSRIPLSPGVHNLHLENAGENISKDISVNIKSGETVSRRPF